MHKFKAHLYIFIRLIHLYLCISRNSFYLQLSFPSLTAQYKIVAYFLAARKISPQVWAK